MPSYWWKCSSCSGAYEFSDVTESKGIIHFIWDELIPSSWDQIRLKHMCERCNTQSLNITYLFPRRDPIELTLIHAVGLSPNGIYVPMMWETIPSDSPEARWFDFKYLNGRNITGLTKPAVFERHELAELFEAYKRVTGESQFP